MKDFFKITDFNSEQNEIPVPVPWCFYFRFWKLDRMFFFFVFSSWSDQSLTKTLVDSVNGLGRYRRGRCNVFLCGAVCQRSSFSFVTVSDGCSLRVKTSERVGRREASKQNCLYSVSRAAAWRTTDEFYPQRVDPCELNSSRRTRLSSCLSVACFRVSCRSFHALKCKIWPL